MRSGLELMSQARPQLHPLHRPHCPAPGPLSLLLNLVQGVRNQGNQFRLLWQGGSLSLSWHQDPPTRRPRQQVSPVVNLGLGTDDNSKYHYVAIRPAVRVEAERLNQYGDSSG